LFFFQDEFQTLNRQSNNNDEEREKLDKEIHHRQQQQIEWDKLMSSFPEDININNESIRKKQSTINCIQNELKQKQHDLDELKKIEKDKTSVYGVWMPDCLKAIENENRFHKKPIGPIGRYIRCIEPRWSYAVEKHLAATMSGFICSDNHDEKILLELFSYYARDYRPTITVRKYSTVVPDISGTLERIRRANLLSIYQVLKIDNITVECTLIDFRQIEATILVEDLQHAKRIRQSGILRWANIDRKVKQVVEAWTYDGSNVKLDKAFRIYTNDRQPARYFTSNNNQSLSADELNMEIKRLNEQVHQMDISINELRKIRQTTIDDFEKMKKATTENKRKIKELNKVIYRETSILKFTISLSDKTRILFQRAWLLRTLTSFSQNFQF
jgi:chromosome segregation ATPase